MSYAKEALVSAKADAIGVSVTPSYAARACAWLAAQPFHVQLWVALGLVAPFILLF